MGKRGRPCRISGSQRNALVAIVEANPTATLAEIQRELKRRTGIEAHGQTIQKALKGAGIQRQVGGDALCANVGETVPPVKLL